MRIAQVAPLFEAVPPKTYGGTERVVSWLTEALVEMGHEVTLFASNDSSTKARLLPAQTRALRLEHKSTDHLVHHYVHLQQVLKFADEFDIVHGHVDYLSFPIFRERQITSVHTLHGRLDLPYLIPLYNEFSDVALVSISNAQRIPLPRANWQSTVYHGMPLDLYRLTKNPRNDYLLFLGRICPEKRVDKAIEIAQRAGIKLKIAAKIDPADIDYFHQQIEPLLEKPNVEFIGEASDSQKNDLIGNALAMLFPIDLPEPFGLVMIESMACGTPVIAFPGGSVPEVIDHGITGYICNSVDEAVKTLDKIDRLDRSHCRQIFENRFSSIRMANDYLRVYEKLSTPKSKKGLLFFTSQFNKEADVDTVKQSAGTEILVSN